MVIATAELPAIAGGTPVRKQLLPGITDPLGRSLGEEEIFEITQVMRSGKLNRNHGSKVLELETLWAAKHDVTFATASATGTAAIHVALGVLPLNPGDEVITTPVTNIGTVLPILSQNCIPVFADIDPRTHNIDPEAVERAITPRTRAIIAVHFMGQSCDMDALMEIAQRHQLYLIEDCAIAHLATWRGRLVGTIGDLGCFSFQQSKHLTCGDGGMTITNDPQWGERMGFFADKGDDRREGRKEHRMFGLNYRMTEMHGAVLLAQLSKADSLISRRQEVAAGISAGIAEVPGVEGPYVAKEAVHTYYYYPLTLVPDILGIRAAEFTVALEAEGLGQVEGLGTAGDQGPLHLWDIFQRQQAFGTSHFPWDYDGRKLEDVDYSPGSCPAAEEFSDPQRSRTLKLPCNAGLSNDDVEDIVQAIRKVASFYAHQHSTG